LEYCIDNFVLMYDIMFLARHILAAVSFSVVE